MFCSNCGSELRETAKFCDRCGAEIKGLTNTVGNEVRIPSAASTASSDQQASGGGSAIAQSPASESSLRRKLALGCMATYLTLVFLMSVRYWGHQNGGNWGSAFGYVVGTSLIPGAIVLVYYNRKKKKESSARVLAVLATWILVANLSAIGRNGSHLTKEDIPVIAKEAAGLIPVSNPTDAGRAAVRDCFKEIIDQNRDYMAKVRASSFEGLYTPRSYLDRQAGQRVVAEIEAGLDIEAAQESAVKEIPSYCEGKINALDWPDGEKKSFIKGFEDKFQESTAKRVPLVTSEKEWFTSLRGLYIYALDNRRYFRAAGAEVRIFKS
jgi:zinc-ribbon domain